LHIPGDICMVEIHASRSVGLHTARLAD
jgi:hypothetical protein